MKYHCGGSEEPLFNHCGARFGMAQTRHPRARGGFSVITFVPRYLHEQKRAGAFRSTARSRPRLCLVVRCGDLALSQKKNMPFGGFFTCSQNTKITPFFVNTEGFRPCLIKPSYGVSQWALMVRLVQKERPKSPQKSLSQKTRPFGLFWSFWQTGHF